MRVACTLLLLLFVGAVHAQTNGTEVPSAADWEEVSEERPIPGFNNKTKLIVCVNPWTPAVYCSNTTDPLEWTGFEIEVFRLTAIRLGLKDTQIDMRCYDGADGFDNVMDDTYASKCDILVAGLAPYQERIDKGLRFSVPSGRFGYGIMVRKQTTAPGMWYFFSAMTWEVWVLMIATGIITGIIVWLFEVGMKALNADTKHMSNVMWDTLGRPVQMRDYRLASLPGNLTAIMWSFLVFILMVIYSANLTANLTVEQIKNDIKGLSDLPGKAVGAWEGAADDLKKYNVAVTPYPWNNQEDEKAMIAALKSGIIKALVFDNNLLEIYDATDCDTMLVGDEFHLLDQTVAFAPNTWRNYPVFVDQYNIAMRYVTQGDGGVEDLMHRFITVQQAPCKSDAITSEYSSVTLTEVSGLWVLLAATVALGILIVLGYHLWIRKIEPWAIKKGFKHHHRVMKSYKTLAMAGWKKDEETGYPDDPADVWGNRYMGASGGYIDGSADVLPPGYGPRANRQMERSDTARREAQARAAMIAAAPQPNLEMQQVMQELAALKDLVMATQVNGNISGGSNVSGSNGGRNDSAIDPTPTATPPSPSRAAPRLETVLTAHRVHYDDDADSVISEPQGVNKV